MSVLENFMKSNECNHNPQLLHLRPSHQEPAHSVERFISFQIFKEQNDRPCGVAFKSSKFYMNFRTFARDLEDFLVEANGIEPMTSCLQSTRSPN